MDDQVVHVIDDDDAVREALSCVLTSGRRMRSDHHLPDPVDIHIGLVIRQRRQALAISQQALGEAVGITLRQVQKYEHGTNRVAASMLLRIATTLKCHPGSFFSGLPSEADNRKERVPEGLARTGRKFLAVHGGPELARAYLAMNADQRRVVLAAARAFQKGRRGRAGARAG